MLVIVIVAYIVVIPETAKPPKNAGMCFAFMIVKGRRERFEMSLDLVKIILFDKTTFFKA